MVLHCYSHDMTWRCPEVRHLAALLRQYCINTSAAIPVGLVTCQGHIPCQRIFECFHYSYRHIYSETEQSIGGEEKGTKGSNL